MVGQWGVPGWDFFHYCCVPAQRNLFARGGDGLCNYLLDHGHLQVYLWMIISIKQSINVHFRAKQFNCLSCFFLIITITRNSWGHKASLHYFSPCQILAFRGYLWVSGRCLECVWELPLSRGRIGNGANSYMSLIEW